MRVNQRRLWREVVVDMGLALSKGSLTVKLRNAYERILFPIEQNFMQTHVPQQVVQQATGRLSPFGMAPETKKVVNLNVYAK